MPADLPNLPDVSQSNGANGRHADSVQPRASEAAFAGDVLGLLQRQEQLLALAVALLRDRQQPLQREALDAGELAATWGVGIRSIRTWDSAGLLPRPVRLGGTRVVWVTRELRAWLAAGCPDRESWEKRKADRRQARARRR